MGQRPHVVESQSLRTSTTYSVRPVVCDVGGRYVSRVGNNNNVRPGNGKYLLVRIRELMALAVTDGVLLRNAGENRLLLLLLLVAHL